MTKCTALIGASANQCVQSHAVGEDKVDAQPCCGCLSKFGRGLPEGVFWDKLRLTSRPARENLPRRLIFQLLCMLFRAASKAASGLARPLVASSKAAFIELQNFPIWGILGMTIPFCTFSYVPLIRGFVALN